MNAATLTPRLGDSTGNPDHQRLQLSLREFFGTVNWDGQEFHNQHPDIPLPSSHATGPLSLNLTVGQFFGSTNWDGEGMAAAAPQLAAPPMDVPPVEDFTLDGFANLF